MLTVAVSAGESQQSSDTSGSLITAAESVGNFLSLQLRHQVGQWSLEMASSDPYTVKVIGERLEAFPLALALHFSPWECLCHWGICHCFEIN